MVFSGGLPVIVLLKQTEDLVFSGLLSLCGISNSLSHFFLSVVHLCEDKSKPLLAWLWLPLEAQRKFFLCGDLLFVDWKVFSGVSMVSLNNRTGDYPWLQNISRDPIALGVQGGKCSPFSHSGHIRVASKCSCSLQVQLGKTQKISDNSLICLASIWYFNSQILLNKLHFDIIFTSFHNCWS